MNEEQIRIKLRVYIRWSRNVQQVASEANLQLTVGLHSKLSVWETGCDKPSVWFEPRVRQVVQAIRLRSRAACCCVECHRCRANYDNFAQCIWAIYYWLPQSKGVNIRHCMWREWSNDELDREGQDTNASKRFIHEVRYYLGRKRRGTCEQQTNSSKKSSETEFAHFETTRNRSESSFEYIAGNLEWLSN